MIIEPADINDVPQLCELINSAYRGETSKQGWTTEADLLGGQRIDEQGLIDIISKSNSVLLKAHLDHKIHGCVHIEKRSEGGYLGMLTVSPKLQNCGLGKKILEEAEKFICTNFKCPQVFMNVITVRTELLNWYKRRGYVDSGEKTPFPSGDPRFGILKVSHLEFVVLRKNF